VDLYHRPGSVFVAEFIGQTNLLRGRVISAGAVGDVVQVDTPAGKLFAQRNSQAADGAAVTLSIRPEQIRIAGPAPATPTTNRVEGRVVASAFLGETSEVVLSVAAAKLKLISSPPLLQVPERLEIEFYAKDAVVLPA
jgi:ABC-type Fe3+/spermidine/putrescine transport system ATPase subunit